MAHLFGKMVTNEFDVKNTQKRGLLILPDAKRIKIPKICKIDQIYLVGNL